MEELSPKDAYKRWAKSYDEAPNPMTAMVSQVLAARGRSPWRVVEFGCGTGRNLTQLVSQGALRVVGVDLSKEMLDVAQVKVKSGVFFEQPLDQEIPLLPGSADLVLVSLVLEHLPDLQRVFEQAMRLLSPGGELLVLELHPQAFDQGSRAKGEDANGKFHTASYKHTAQALQASAIAAGFLHGKVVDLHPDEALLRAYPSNKRAEVPWLLQGSWQKPVASKPIPIDRNAWPRQQVFEFYHRFDDPYFNISTSIPVTGIRPWCKARGLSLHLVLLHCVMRAVHAIPELCVRMEQDSLVYYPTLNISSTLLTPQEQLRFAYYMFDQDLQTFIANAERGSAECLANANQLHVRNDQDLVYYSNLPWTTFSTIKHARHFAPGQTVPRFAIGRMQQTTQGTSMLPVSIETHHGLADGLHTSRFFQFLEAAVHRLMSDGG